MNMLKINASEYRRIWRRLRTFIQWFVNTKPIQFFSSEENKLNHAVKKKGLGWRNQRIFVMPFPNKPWFLRVCSTSLLKTLWKKEKLLVTSNFSFSPQCFLTVCRTFCHFIKLEIVVW